MFADLHANLYGCKPAGTGSRGTGVSGLPTTACGHQGQGRAAFRLVLPTGEKQSEWHILEAGSRCDSLVAPAGSLGAEVPP